MEALLCLCPRWQGHELSLIHIFFNVTDVTIRQDLEALEQMGYIQREHGGAFLKGVGSVAKTGQLFNQTHLEEKKEIAQKAIQFIQEGDSIIPVSYTHLKVNMEQRLAEIKVRSFIDISHELRTPLRCV